MFTKRRNRRLGDTQRMLTQVMEAAILSDVLVRQLQQSPMLEVIIILAESRQLNSPLPQWTTDLTAGTALRSAPSNLIAWHSTSPSLSATTMTLTSLWRKVAVFGMSNHVLCTSQQPA